LSKIKTSILVDKELWEKFKLVVGVERGSRELSEAVTDAIREELCEIIIAEALEKMLSGKKPPLKVRPVKPLTPTDSGATVRELRERRT